MENGYVKLYRKIKEWEWYTNIPTKVLFFHLMLECNHAPHKWRGIEVKTGQTITSLQHLADDSGLSVQSVRTALKNLEKTGEVNKQSTNKWTLITLENFAFYQGKEDSSTSSLTNKQQTTNKQTTTNKKNKNDKNNNLIKSNTNAFVKPTVKEVSEYIKEKGYSIDAEHFVAYYESNGWKVGRNPMKSWKSALVTWERRNDSKRNRKVEDKEVESYDDVIFGQSRQD